MNMTDTIDCPICMDCIETASKNCVTTECGHCFHTKCLMQSVAHTGFDCPYCRTVMAEVPDEELSEYDDDEEYDDVDEEDILRGVRFFFNNMYGETHDDTDVQDEAYFIAAKEEERTNRPATPIIPSTEVVANKLREQNVTFEQLVRVMCLEHGEYRDYDLIVNDGRDDRMCDVMYGKIRAILAQHTRRTRTENPPL